MSPVGPDSRATGPKPAPRERVRVERVAVGDLVAFVDGYLEGGGAQTIAPLTPQRALSHSKNPHASPDDIGLVVAYVGDRCVGYQGLLPVHLASGTRRSGKVMWSTSMYVMPEYRDQLVALQLIRTAIGRDVDVVLNEFSDEAGQLFRGLRFQDMPVLTFLRLRVDLLNLFGHPFQLLARPSSRARFIRSFATRALSLTRMTGYLGLRRLYYALARGQARLPDGFQYRVVDRVRSLPAAELQKTQEVRFERSVETVNWMLETPWVLDDGPPTVPPFYFADTSELFRYLPFEIADAGGAYKGFAVMSVRREGRRTTLKLLDHQVAPDVPLDVVRAIALRQAREYRADVVELPQAFDASLGRLPLRRVLLQTVEREYLCRPAGDESLLASERFRLSPSLCDGDTAFW